jgi:hypothetical protein
VRKEPPLNDWEISIDRYINVSDFSDDIRILSQVEGARASGFDPSSDYCPIFEGKLFNQFDHRFATYRGTTELAATEELTDRSPGSRSECIYLLPTAIAVRRNPTLDHSPGLLVVRDITNRTNARGVIAAIIPPHITDYTIRVIQMEPKGQRQLLLLAILNSFVFDFLARQRIGGTHLSNYVLEQTPCPPPACLSPEDIEFVASRALQLTYTALDLRNFARACGWNADPFGWDEDRRFLIRCELDAFLFRLYGLSPDDVVYIMDTFPLVRRNDMQRKRQAGCMAPGYYKRPDEEMLSLWRTGVQETAKHYRE